MNLQTLKYDSYFLDLKEKVTAQRWTLFHHFLKGEQVSHDQLNYGLDVYISYYLTVQNLKKITLKNMKW